MTGWQTGPPKIKKKGQWLTGWQASPPKTKKNGHWMKSAFCISYKMRIFFVFPGVYMNEPKTVILENDFFETHKIIPKF